MFDGLMHCTASSQEVEPMKKGTMIVGLILIVGAVVAVIASPLMYEQAKNTWNEFASPVYC